MTSLAVTIYRTNTITSLLILLYMEQTQGNLSKTQIGMENCILHVFVHSIRCIRVLLSQVFYKSKKCAVVNFW